MKLGVANTAFFYALSETPHMRPLFFGSPALGAYGRRAWIQRPFCKFCNFCNSERGSRVFPENKKSCCLRVQILPPFCSNFCNFAKLLQTDLFDAVKTALPYVKIYCFLDSLHTQIHGLFAGFCNFCKIPRKRAY